MTETIFILSGLVLLFAGGEALLRGSVSLARSLKISKILIGAVIIGFGTSMPELTVSVGAALKDASDIALGNVIGSNIANILLIIGVSALISPIDVNDTSIRRDVLGMTISSIMLLVFMWLDALTFTSGLVFLTILSGYIFWSFKEDKQNKNNPHKHMEEDSTPDHPYKPSVAFLMTIAGLAALIGGASLLVDGAISIATSYGIPEAVIGLTLVAVGTALPEIAIAIIASLRNHSDVVLGNIMGSNIFNVLAIIGITVLIHPITVSEQLMAVDIWIMLLVTVLLGSLLFMKIRIGRSIAVMMLISYFSYSAWLYLAN